MAERLFIALYFDENIPVSLAATLRHRGIGAIAAQEAGLKGATDDEQMAYATRTGHALVTSNVRHFLSIFRQFHDSGRNHPGLILVTRPMSIGEMVKALNHLVDTISADEMQSQIAFLSDYL